MPRQLGERTLKLRRCWGVALLTLVGGCSALPNSPWRSAQPGQAKTVVRLSGWQSSPTEKQQLQRVLAEFEQRHPHIRVEYEVINSEYMDVLKTRLIGGVGPDVFYLEAFEAPALMKYGVLEPLEGYLDQAYDIGDFEPTLLRAFQHRGQTLGIPKDFSTLALLYRPDRLAAVGIPQPPATWSALQSASRRLTRKDPKSNRITQYGLGISPELARQAMMLRAYGGSLVNSQGQANFAENMTGLNLVVQQYRDRTSAQPTDVGASSGSDMLGQGKAAMVIEGPWALPYLRENFPNVAIAAAEVPQVNGRPSTMAFTVAYALNRQSKVKPEAWQLVKFLTDKPRMARIAQQGSALPSRRSVMAKWQPQDPNLAKLYAPFLRGAPYAMIWQAGEHLPTIRTHFNNQFSSVLIGEQDLQPAMQKAQQDANREISWMN
jgi:multiple sugar transport system substrate-binding protein